MIQYEPAQLEMKLNCILGEGAYWDAGILYFIDILGQELMMYDPQQKILESLTVPSPIGTVVTDRRGRPVVALAEGIFRLENREFIFLTAHPRPTQRFNDGKCDPKGRLWVGTMKENKKAGLWMLDHQGRLHHKLDGVSVSNGIVWTKDAKTMYYIDSPLRKIKAYDFDLDSGEIENPRIIYHVPKSMGYPDGMTIDDNDELWIALYGGGAVMHLDPLKAEIKGLIKVPVSKVTSCVFAGRHLDHLYITTAREGMDDAQLLKEAMAGSLFRAIPGVKGRKQHSYGN